MLDTQRMQTRLDAAWIEKVVKNNPSRILTSGNVILPPARMAFCKVAMPGKDSIINGVMTPGRYGSSILFTPDADLSALTEARMAMIPTAFPKNPKGLGLADPIRDQGERVAPSEGGINKKGTTTAGFVPGCKFIAPNANLEYPPALIRYEGGAPVSCIGAREELQRVFYSGIWAICTVNVFHGKNPQNPNVFYGLSTVMKIADDNTFQGSGGDGVEAYNAVNIDIDSTVDPAALFA